MSCTMSPPNAAPQWTLASDIRAVLADESMCDVDLVGNDGGRVSASRFVLGARSRVFRRMLFGTFIESSSEEIHLDYPTSILSAVVVYCYTDEVIPFPGDGSDDEERARAMVRVFSAAHYFELLALETGLAKMIEEILDRAKPLACAVFDETCGQGPDASKMKSLAVDTIRSYPEESMLTETMLDRPGVSMLGSDAISNLMCDNEIRAEELTIFLVLRKWTKVGQSGSLTQKQKEETARSCAATINLLHISPSDLVGAVQKSGLVPNESIISALKQQSLLAEKSPVVEREPYRRSVLFSKKVKFSRRSSEDPAEEIGAANIGNGNDEDFIRRALRAEKKGFSFSGCRAAPISTLNQVVIEGAGCDSVNGTYLEDGTFGGLPKYCKKGEWQGRETNFVIYCWRSKVWYIAEVPMFGSLGKDSNDLYLSDCSGRDLLPESAWRMDRLGQEPPPQSKIISAKKRHSFRRCASSVF